MSAAPKELQKSTWMTNYLTSTLCRAMGIAPIFDEIELPARGLGSNLLIVRPRSAAPFVLHCLKHRPEAERLVEVLKITRGHGLPVPRLLYAEFSESHFRAHGFGAIVEAYIPGGHREAGEASPEELVNLARALARLHEVQSDTWGDPLKPRRSAFFDSAIVPSIEQRAAALVESVEEFGTADRKQVLGFVKGYRKGWDGGPPFSLIHDKIKTGSVIFAPGDETFLIDLQSAQFGTPGRDLVAALDAFCKGVKQQQDFKQAYFLLAGSRAKEHFERFAPLYWVWHHLGRWASKARTARKTAPEQEAASAESRQRERDALRRWLDRG